MTEVKGVGQRRHFSTDEEEALRRDESTSHIIKRDTKATVDIFGTDRSWIETKHHQRSPFRNPVTSGAHLCHTAAEGAELAGWLHLGSLGIIGGAAGGFALGLHELHEAHEKADEQKAALIKDTMHVALIGVLDLPESYKAGRLEGAYKHIPKGANSPAFKMTEAIVNDPKGRATLQLHADRGMNAARDLSRSGMTEAAFLKANPKLAASYDDDPAFREGFDAYTHAKARLSPAEAKNLDAKLDERDGWYMQSQITFHL